MIDSAISLLARVNHLEQSSPYGYTPGKAPGYAYVVVFGVGLLLHIGLAVRYKYWIAMVTLIPGGLLEILGWAGRLWSAEKPTNSNPFLMQICCLILGPAFFSAWAYTILGYCITRLGSAYSLLKPKWYLITFVSADIISLVLQAIGGGRAAVAAKLGTNTHTATQIMLAGILFQLVTMTVFVVLAVDFIARVILRKPYAFQLRRSAAAAAESGSASDSETQTHTPNGSGIDAEAAKSTSTSLAGHGAGAGSPESESGSESDPAALRRAEWLLAGVAFASLMIYVRGIYRAIELAQGWSGYLITHEPYFIYLDGLPMVLCYYAFAALHPGFLLPRRQGWGRA
ncbi:hypothetical protein JCM24511_00701 [Saitozyma sp. JCM 24511]|nr:hypothetical protein JCM24511_00701 [Saitozyma sp. JCM 24511]